MINEKDVWHLNGKITYKKWIILDSLQKKNKKGLEFGVIQCKESDAELIFDDSLVFIRFWMHASDFCACRWINWA